MTIFSWLLLCNSYEKQNQYKEKINFVSFQNSEYIGQIP